MGSAITRRQLGKGLLAGAALGTILADAEGQANSIAPQQFDSRWTPVAPGIWKATVGSPEAVTPVSSRLVGPRLEALRTLPSVNDPPLAAPEGIVGRRGTLLAFPLAAHEEIYGFGLQLYSVAHRGQKRLMRVNATCRTDTGDSHAPVPFYVTSRGYGVLVDTARYATFYCGEVLPKPTEPVGPHSSYTGVLGDDDRSEVFIEIPSAQGVDVYLFAGPSILDAVRRYNLFSGGGAMPPEWGLGLWYRVSGDATDQQILALAHEFRERQIPCDVIGLEGSWHTHIYTCTFAWNTSNFPHPGRFLNDLKSRDYHVNLWEHPFTHPSSPLFLPMRDLAGDKNVWGGLVPDFQNPEARRVFGDYHGKELIDLGISGFKLDECDNSDFTGDWSFPEFDQFPSGVDGEQMHSLFGLRYQFTIWQQFQQRNLPTYSLVRSSGALAAPYPFVLYSDLYDHQAFVRGVVNCGFSGLLWCPEVRDTKSEEELIRRLQTVVFSPLAQIDGYFIPNPPWKQFDVNKNRANDLMPNWQELEARCREIMGWRMRLVPYLRAAFARYATDGTPPFRALALDWPDLPDVAKAEDAWMMGDRMLVAPLFAGEPQRKLALPPGQWHNFWTGEAVTGGTILDIPADTRNIPVFVMAGSVLPLASIANSTVDPASRCLEVRIFGDGHLPFSLITPDGDTLHLDWSAGTHTGTVKQEGRNHYTILRWTLASPDRS